MHRPHPIDMPCEKCDGYHFVCKESGKALCTDHPDHLKGKHHWVPCPSCPPSKGEPKCKTCYDKGFYSVMDGTESFEDFGGEGVKTPPKIREVPCPKCSTPKPEGKHGNGCSAYDGAGSACDCGYALEDPQDEEWEAATP